MFRESTRDRGMQADGVAADLTLADHDPPNNHHTHRGSRLGLGVYTPAYRRQTLRAFHATGDGAGCGLLAAPVFLMTLTAAEEHVSVGIDKRALFRGV